MKKYTLIKQAIATTLLLTSIPLYSACTKKVDCDINGKHVHVYVNEDKLLKRYIESEKVSVNNLNRTDDYLPLSNSLKIEIENDLYRVEDNIEYLKNIINEHPKKRQAYVYDYIYGTYTGIGRGLNPMTGNYEYFYGLHTGYHYGYEWQDIPINEYTEDKVRDITYTFEFYKINSDGTISSKQFNNLEEVSKEYCYFKVDNIVIEHKSDSYYLSNEKTK